jgi:cyclopropane fatty-acyl-phospholipid synthase-like methyltransferase
MALQQQILAALFLAASLAQSPLHAQETLPRSTSTPYTGDFSIFEEKGRDEKLQIQRVLDILHVAPGKSVADIGAGGGWFTVRAAKRVGEDGRVYGEDINPAAVKAIEQRAEKQHLPQVRAVLGLPDDPRLPPAILNAVLLLKAYHEIARPEEFMRHLRGSLAPGARIGIIDRNGNGSDHGLKQSVVEREMDEAGFREIEHYDFTKADGQDYFLVFMEK